MASTSNEKKQIVTLSEDHPVCIINKMVFTSIHFCYLIAKGAPKKFDS
jgi:hypothetical protein